MSDESSNSNAQAVFDSEFDRIAAEIKAKQDAEPAYQRVALEDIPLWAPTLDQCTSEEAQNTIAALSSLIYDDSTPDEIADNFKNQGNDLLKEGKRRWNDVLECYEKALQQNIQSSTLKATLLSNRAHVHLLKGNNGKALADAQQALELTQNGNVKAAYRAAKACVALSKWELALKYSEIGLQLEPNDQALREFQTKAKTQLDQEQRRQDVLRQESSRQQQQRGSILRLIKERGIRLGPDEVNTAQWGTVSDLTTDKGQPPITLNASTNELHFEVLIIYDEESQSDFIRDFAESDTFLSQLAEMFPPMGPPPPFEDPQQRYVISNLALFFYIVDEDRYVEIAPLETLTLGQIIRRPDYVLPGLRPIFHVVCKDSKLAERWGNCSR